MSFPITCPACGKAFQLATEIYERKVAGKVVSIKCKQCQSGIRVDATVPGELKVVGASPAGGGDLSVGPKPPQDPAPQAQPKPQAAPAAATRPAAAPVRMRQPTLIGMVNPAATGPQKPGVPAPPPVIPAAPAAGPKLWAVDTGGNDDRELSDDEIQREILDGKLTAQTLAWREGMAEWLEIEKIPELSGFLGSPPEVPKKAPAPRAAEVKAPAEAARAAEAKAPAPAPRTAEPKAPPREAPKPDLEHEGYQEEPDAEATRVYDRSAPDAALEPFASDPPLKTDPLMTPPLPAAGRPAPPPAAFAPPPPAPPALPKASPPPRVAAPAPAAPPPTPAAPAFPPVAARPPALADVPWGDALPSAKPQAPALPTAPLGPDPFAVAASRDLDFPNPRSKRPLVIGVVVGLVAVVGIGIVIASSGGTAPPNIAAPPPAPTVAAPTPKATDPEPAETSAPKQEDSPTPAAPSPAASGNFSDLFAKGAEKAKGSGDSRGFDEAAGREALSPLLKAAASCKEPGGPTGQATATVTFEPSGSVSNVTVGAPFAGSSTGTCVITAFKRAKVARFTGLPGTVQQIISLR
jgi:hypothetical protein